jgi:hypothetical protein
MDMSQYNGAAFLKVGDVKVNGPIRVVIADIVLGKYGKPDVSFSDGPKLSLNATNNKTLCQAYARRATTGSARKSIVLGEIEYQGKPQQAVLVKPISPPIKKPPSASPAATFHFDL